MDKRKIWRPRTQVRALALRDERFAQLVEQVGMPSIELYPSSFESIAHSIAYQQLAGPAASAIWGRVCALFEDDRPEPAAALRKRDATYRKAGLSGPKTQSLKDLARHITGGHLDPEGLASMADEEVIDALTQVRGIGPWSAQMHLMFSLARPDVWPTGDLGVRRGWARFMGHAADPTPHELEALGEPYRPYRSILAWYMWRVLDVEDWL